MIIQGRPINPTGIRLLVSDLDGVWTDGSIFLDDRGIETKRFSVYDGAGVVRARKAGIRIAILTARRCRSVALRAQALGVDLTLQGSRDKGRDFLAICRQLGVSPEETLYMGDDHADLPAFALAAAAITVPNAPADIRAQADAITDTAGGSGALREVVDWLLSTRS